MTLDELRVRNGARARVVPEAALRRMRSRWQMPDRTEAHAVTWNDAEAGPGEHATAGEAPSPRAAPR